MLDEQPTTLWLGLDAAAIVKLALYEHYSNMQQTMKEVLDKNIPARVRNLLEQELTGYLKKVNDLILEVEKINAPTI